MAEICWYCEFRPAEHDALHTVEMHYRKMVPASNHSFELACRNTTVKIPRCPECKARFDEREQALRRNALTVVLAAAGITILGALFLGILAGDFTAFIGGLILGSVVAIVISSPVLAIREAAIHRRYQELKMPGDYPAVKTLLRLGAKWGHRAATRPTHG